PSVGHPADPPYDNSTISIASKRAVVPADGPSPTALVPHAEKRKTIFCVTYRRSTKPKQQDQELLGFCFRIAVPWPPTLSKKTLLAAWRSRNMIEKRTQKKFHNAHRCTRLGILAACAHRPASTPNITRDAACRCSYVSFLMRVERRDSLRDAALRWMTP